MLFVRSKPRRALKAQEKTMGQKINPIGLRLGINRAWDSRWFAGKGEYASLLHEDVRVREVLRKGLKQAAVAGIVNAARRCTRRPPTAITAWRLHSPRSALAA